MFNINYLRTTDSLLPVQRSNAGHEREYLIRNLLIQLGRGYALLNHVEGGSEYDSFFQRNGLHLGFTDYLRVEPVAPQGCAPTNNAE